MTFILLTSMSTHNKLSTCYFSQLDAAGIPFHIYPNQMISPSDGTLDACLTAWRKCAEDYSSYSRLIITDAWDVLCYGTLDGIQDKLDSFPSYPIFAAERNCYPEPELANSINGPTPWRFVNGGMLTAAPAALFDWCDKVSAHSDFSPSMIAQQWLNRRLVASDPIAQIDSTTTLFYCMFLEHLGNELENKDGKPYNKLTDTYPAFVHFNGSWPWEPFLEMMRNGH